MSGKKQRMTTTMSPEKQQIAIAKACGWTYEEKVIAYIRPEPFKHWTDPDGEYLGLYDIPDYLYDLNAMHEAESTLSVNDTVTYATNLTRGHDIWEVMPNDEHFSVCYGAIHATAQERAKAFLKTLNLWTDD